VKKNSLNSLLRKELGTYVVSFLVREADLAKSVLSVVSGHLDEQTLVTCGVVVQEDLAVAMQADEEGEVSVDESWQSD
jgi:hypothetical protein